VLFRISLAFALARFCCALEVEAIVARLPRSGIRMISFARGLSAFSLLGKRLECR